MKKVSSIVAVALLSVSFLFTSCREGGNTEATQAETPAVDTTAQQAAPAAVDTTQQAAPADTTQKAQ